MASIKDIPLELLNQIVWHLQDDKAALTTLALVSSTFSSLVPPALLNAISFTVDEGQLATNPRQYTPLEHLLQRFAVKPELAVLVHSLDLTWYCRSGFNEFEVDAETELRVGRSMIDKLLGNVQSLRYLRYSAPVFGTDYFRPDFLSKNKMKFLTEVIIAESSTTYSIIVAFMLLERIRALTVSSVMRRSRLDMSLSNPDQHTIGVSPSPIESLTLGASMTPEDIRLFCSIANELKCLSFGFKYSAEPWNWAIGTVLRPSLFSWAMSPSKHSLESLAIQSDKFEALDVDGTCLDLHEFLCLRTLTLPSNFIFTTAEDDPSRDGLWKLLPPQLEHLKISFTEGQELVGIRSTGPGLPAALNWLHELALYKKTNLPKLTRVCIQGLSPQFVSDVLEALPPIRKTYEENEIDLKLWNFLIARRASHRSLSHADYRVTHVPWYDW